MVASAWIALAAMVTAAVGTLAGLMLHGFSSVNKRIDDTNRQLADELRKEILAIEPHVTVEIPKLYVATKPRPTLLMSCHRRAL